MLRRFAAALIAFAPAIAWAQDAHCWVSYAGFEETVKHLDISRCPGNDPAPDQGHCRLALHGNDVLIYVFRDDSATGERCLVRIMRQDFNSFAALHGTAYREQ